MLLIQTCHISIQVNSDTWGYCSCLFYFVPVFNIQTHLKLCVFEFGKATLMNGYPVCILRIENALWSPCVFELLIETRETIAVNQSSINLCMWCLLPLSHVARNETSSKKRLILIAFCYEKVNVHVLVLSLCLNDYEQSW